MVERRKYTEKSKEFFRGLPGVKQVKGAVTGVSEKIRELVGGIPYQIEKKRHKNIAVTREEFSYILDNKFATEGLLFSSESFTGVSLNNIGQKDIENIHFKRAKFRLCTTVQVNFNHCKFQGCIFEKLGGYIYNFHKCDLSVDSKELEALEYSEFGEISAQRVDFEDCFVKGIRMRGNSYDSCDDISDFSHVILRKRSKKEQSFSESFEENFVNDFTCTATIKINKLGIIEVGNEKGETKRLKVIFRKARGLLGLIFLETYKIGDDYLHKNMIYILDNNQNKRYDYSGNFLRDDIHNQLSNICKPFHDNGENIVIYVDQGGYRGRQNLVFKLVRPISVDGFNSKMETFTEQLDSYLKNNIKFF